MNFTTLADVLEAFAQTAEAALPGDGKSHVGDVSTRDVDRGFRLAVFPKRDSGVDHEGYSRRTASVVVKLIAVDDPSDASAGATQLIRLVRLFEPAYYAIFHHAKANTQGFDGMEVWVQDDAATPGISADGYDDNPSDRRARIGATFTAVYNRQLPTPNPTP
ncbi:MAG: hypothetical protein AAF333_13340 [Planctomycetota bacterium]